jgi:hypothetical protein
MFILWSLNWFKDSYSTIGGINILTGFIFSKISLKLNFFSYCDQTWLESIGPEKIFFFRNLISKNLSKTFLIEIPFFKFSFFLIFYIILIIFFF